jgi:hypothetical protein
MGEVTDDIPTGGKVKEVKGDLESGWRVEPKVEMKRRVEKRHR